MADKANCARLQTIASNRGSVDNQQLWTSIRLNSSWQGRPAPWAGAISEDLRRDALVAHTCHPPARRPPASAGEFATLPSQTMHVATTHAIIWQICCRSGSIWGGSRVDLGPIRGRCGDRSWADRGPQHPHIPLGRSSVGAQPPPKLWPNFMWARGPQAFLHRDCMRAQRPRFVRRPRP